MTNKRNCIGLILEEAGRKVAIAFDASKAIPIDELITAPPMGPFLIQAEVISPRNGEHKKIDMLAAVNDHVIHVFSRKLPILAPVIRKYSIRNGIRHEIAEEYNTDKEILFELDPIEMIKTVRPKAKSAWFWLSFDKRSNNPWCSIYLDDDKTIWSIPFYNFFTNGNVCMGESGADEGNTFKRLISLFNSYATPHNTYDESGKFSFRPPRGLMDEAPKIDPNAPGGEEGSEYEKWINSKLQEFKLCYNAKEGHFPTPRDLTGVNRPPECLGSIKKRKALIGKLMPTI